MSIQEKDKRGRETESSEGEDPPKKKKKKKKRAEGESTALTARQRAKDRRAEREKEAADEAAGTPDAPESDGEPEDGASDALVALGGEGASIDKAGDGEPDELAAGSEAAREGEELEDEPAAAQLGADRYVLAAFFAMGMMGAYVLGRIIHGVWSSVANKDWFSQTLPRLASVNDDDKGTIGIIIGGVVAIIAVLRTYRRPDIREWSDEVAAELTKVKWPNKKDVTNSTIVVIAASTVATLYLFLLDRLWAFVTNLVYGSGS